MRGRAAAEAGSIARVTKVAPCGLVRQATASDGVVVGEYRLQAGYRHRRHTHAHRGVALGLDGVYVASVGRREHALGPGAALAFPDGAAHRERAGDRGSHCLLLQLASDRGELVARGLARDRVVAAPGLTLLAQQLAGELGASDGAHAIALDALAADIFAELGVVVEQGGGDRPGAWVWSVREELDDRFTEPPSLAELSARVGRSREHVARSFRRRFGRTIGDHVRARRIDAAAQALATSDAPVAAVAASAGFADQSHLTRCFRRRYGTTPGAYRATRRR